MYKKGTSMKKILTTTTLILLLSACNNTATSPSNIKNSSTSQNEIVIDGLTYQHKNYGEEMNWDSAKKYCQNRGDKWRLPRFNELQKLTYKRKLKSYPKSHNIFWTADEDNSMPEGDYHFTISSTGQLGTNEGRLIHSVLCVK